MKMITVMLGAAAILASAQAFAASDGRTVTGAAIGAGAGAVVAGPVGAVAGGVAGAAIGGPKITKNGRHRIYWHDKAGKRHWRWSE